MLSRRAKSITKASLAKASLKGLGEDPTTGSPPAVVNAVLDALRGHGVHAIDVPLTPERAWRASQDAHSAAVVGMSWHPARS